MHRQSMIAYCAPLEETEIDTPVPTGTQVLVKITHCGVCHSDLHMIDGYFDMGDDKKLDVTGGRTLPFTLGHEIAGQVVAVGPDAQQVSEEENGNQNWQGASEIGSACAVYPWIGCGDCAMCESGDEHLCQTTHHLGITVDGGYASHVMVPHPRYILDISGIERELAGGLMCSGITAYGALKKAMTYMRGGPLVIVGAGGVGMMGLQLAKSLWNGPVVVADIDGEKRDAALAAGADQVFDPQDKEARKAIFKSCGAANASIDFVGAESSLHFAQSVLGKGAGVIVVGLLGGKYSTPIPMFALRPFSIHGTFVASLPETKELLDLVRSGKISPPPVSTRPLDQANQALDDLRHGRVIGRVVLEV